DRVDEPDMPRQVRRTRLPHQAPVRRADATTQPGLDPGGPRRDPVADSSPQHLDIRLASAGDEPAGAENSREEEGVDLVGRVDDDVRCIRGTEPLRLPRPAHGPDRAPAPRGASNPAE